MTFFVLLLVLLSALIHATWNLWIKQMAGGSRGPTQVWLLTALSAALYAPIGVWGLASGAWRPGPEALPWIVVSSALHVVYFLLLLRGYRHGDLSLVYPVARGTGPLLAAAGAIAFLGESPTPLGITGALLITCGVLLLAAPPRPAPGTPIAPHATRAGLGYGLATGVLIAAYTLWDGAAVRHAGMSPLYFYWATEVVRVVLIAPLAWHDRDGASRLWRTHRLRLLGIAALSPLAYIIVLFAFRLGPLTHVAPAREVSILFGTWLGARMLGEGQRSRRRVAAAAFVLGIVALAGD